MSILKTQFGQAITANFEELTWTFEMPKNYEVAAGNFAIVPKEKYDKLIETFNRILKIENEAFGLKSFDVERLKKEIKEAVCSVS